MLVPSCRLNRSTACLSDRGSRMLLSEVKLFARRGLDFGFESTLSGKTHLNLIRRLKARGYAVHIFFLWVASPEVSLSRIENRVREGGHDVPAPVVRRRFTRCIRNFLLHYRPLADSWMLFDNSGEAPVAIAVQKQGKLSIMSEEIYTDLLSLYGTK
jgi:predicted ABC-type ATPase